MKISLERKIYFEIQKKLFSIIPEKWESIYLYASVIDMPNKRVTGEMYFYYFPKSFIKTKPINCYEIPSAFNLDEAEYGNIISEIYNLMKNLNKVYYKKYNKKWTNATISIKNGVFKIEYDYSKLTISEVDSYERHIVWRYLYLSNDEKLFSKKEKMIIKKYKNFITREKNNDNIHIEKMYEIQVRNIMDFEKTLSVDEALAQSESDINFDEEKNKHGLFKRKKRIDDIIEDDEKLNNQILNWKK